MTALLFAQFYFHESGPLAAWFYSFAVIIALFVIGGKKLDRWYLEHSRPKPPDPAPEKYAYRSLFIGVILFILAAGALVFTLGIEGYLP